MQSGFQLVCNPTVHQCLIQAFIGIPLLDVFPDKGNVHRVFGIFQPVHQFDPGLEHRPPCPHFQVVGNRVIQSLLLKHQRRLINRLDFETIHYRIFLNIGEK